LKVLHINASYKPAFIYGGPTMSVSMLCEQLVKAGASITVFTTTANGPNELPVTVNQPSDIDGVTVVYFKRISKDHTHFSPPLLMRLWSEVKSYDLVHIHAWWNLVSILSCLVAIIRKVPVIISPRGTLSGYSFSNNNTLIKQVIHQFLGKPLLKKSHFHVTSRQEETAMLQLVKPKSITVIPNLVKLPIYNASIKKTFSPYLKLIFLSRIEAKKGLDILLNALPLVNIPYELTIAGDGEDDYINYLKKIANENQVADKITWEGFQSESKFDMLRDNDLFVLPSYDENFGNAVIESLAKGTAVLISEQVGLADYVLKNDLGWVFEANIISLSMAINNIGTKHIDVIEIIRKQAHVIIYNDFDPDNLAEKYLTMYNQII
jgi:glycosyltransferase involved in cell wall biosynthesis